MVRRHNSSLRQMTTIDLFRSEHLLNNQCQTGDILVRYHEPHESDSMFHGCEYAICSHSNGYNDDGTPFKRPVYKIRIQIKNGPEILSDSWWWDKYDHKDKY